MSVAYSAITASSSFADDTTFSSPNEANIKGALVFIVGATAASAPDEITGVTWGGVAMARVTTAADLITEFIRSYAYFLGSGIPTGTQTVSIDCSGTVTTKQAYAIALTAASDTAVEGFNTVTADVDDPSCTITTGAGVETWVGAVIGSGLGVTTNVTAGAGYTLRANRDFGNQVLQVETINANDAGGNVVANFITSASDDVAMIAVAIKEAGGATVTLATAIAGAGTIAAAALARTRGLQAAIAGLAAVAPAKLARQEGLQVAISGSSAVSPSVTVAGTITLRVAIQGAGAVAASLARQEAIQVAIQGVGTITPALRGTFALATQIAEAGVVSPTLSVSTPVGSGGPGGGANAGAFVPALLPFLRRKR